MINPKKPTLLNAIKETIKTKKNKNNRKNKLIEENKQKIIEKTVKY